MPAPSQSDQASSTTRQPFSLGLSALVAGLALFSINIDLDLLGYALVGMTILLLLHTGLSIGTAVDASNHGGLKGFDRISQFDLSPPHRRS